MPDRLRSASSYPAWEGSETEFSYTPALIMILLPRKPSLKVVVSK